MGFRGVSNTARYRKYTYDADRLNFQKVDKSRGPALRSGPFCHQSMAKPSSEAFSALIITSAGEASPGSSPSGALLRPPLSYCSLIEPETGLGDISFATSRVLLDKGCPARPLIAV